MDHSASTSFEMCLGMFFVNAYVRFCLEVELKMHRLSAPFTHQKKKKKAEEKMCMFNQRHLKRTRTHIRPYVVMLKRVSAY